MINHHQLQAFGADLITTGTPAEVCVRRAVSSMYYALFHRLTGSAAAVFDSGGTTGPAIAAQVTRAFSHTTIRKVCDAYARSPKQTLPAPLNRLQATAPDPRLVSVAKIFGRLQEAREIADYDMGAAISQADGLSLLERAEFAHAKLDQIAGSPDLHIFLTALLLADRWTRRA